MHTALSTQAFDAVVRLFARESGIQLVPAKRQLVAGRLGKLAARRGTASLDEYVQLLMRGDAPDELTAAVDALTTNETYFYREPKHFEFLAAMLKRLPRGAPVRAWSAASSSGEEAFTLAMLMAEALGPDAPWEIVGTDLSTAMVDSARRALYPMERAQRLPPELLRRWCLKGEGSYAGHLLIARELREHVRFINANLLQPLPDIGRFDIVLLRNVLIYFEPPQKQQILQAVLARLKPGGYFLPGHAESINGVDLGLQPQAPAIYRKPPRDAA